MAHDTHQERMTRAQRALEALAMGDAFGEQFFAPLLIIVPRITSRKMDSEGVWRWTDDTAMALSIVEELEAHQEIRPDSLSARFAARYAREPWRGYGGGAHTLFERIAAGEPYDFVAHTLFENQGSFGNGGAMRVAPLGAYFADDIPLAAEMAARSAEPTHAHPEGVAGAIAIAVVSAAAWQARSLPLDEARERIWDTALEHTPQSETRRGIAAARTLGEEAEVALAAQRLGSGAKVSSQDTVPFCIWSVCRNLRHIELAMWETVEAMGDRDTTCAIVAGVLANASDAVQLPPAWLTHVEPLSGIPLSDTHPRYR